MIRLVEDDVEGKTIFEGLTASCFVDFGKVFSGEGFEGGDHLHRGVIEPLENVSKEIAVLASVRGGEPVP